jgi:PAS domain S-box-containing protein
MPVTADEVDPDKVILAPEPVSAGIARRHVTTVLDEAGAAALVDQAQLLVSEVVTNALLHSGGPIGLSVAADEGWACIEVHDTSSLAPSPRHYDDEATTGRGLEIVEVVASRWGVIRQTGGKVVWFELGQPPSAHADQAGRSTTVATATPTGTVRLLNMPPHLVVATLERGDALLREIALLQLGEATPPGPGERRPEIALPVGPVLEVAEAAVAAGQFSVNTVVEMPATAADVALERLGLTDEAERLASTGELLSPPAVPELISCRRWLLGQIALQLRGEPPTPWELPGADSTVASPTVLDSATLEGLQAMGPAVIAADSTNHILFVTPGAADLLGWDPDALLTRRLTTIIPPDLRQAHLAGFTRYQLTGEARILGRTVRLPALRRDGTIVEVDLTICRFGPTNPALFAATLAPQET